MQLQLLTLLCPVSICQTILQQHYTQSESMIAIEKSALISFVFSYFLDFEHALSVSLSLLTVPFRGTDSREEKANFTQLGQS